MDESLKVEITESIKENFPDLSEERITNLLEIVLLEIESYNTCKNDIPWKKLKNVIIEVLYQMIKNASEKTVSSVRRGDTTISYASTSTAVSELLVGYGDLIRRVIGCGGLEFF
ncbi:hypothetical protein BH747_12180 [Enterococcus villorum]|uniref:Uncharacterized protein n=1 Tax=Enterococcus villorum TaxID=112904 RepID=A0A1V8YPV4_9ENTE|nr:hypothetical protein [Enterococcus villorum]OQO68429.1 hypothetical protein BH747_12180 [Enterococcus villorum]OQO74376.1 hypothetical protein BH744_07530 [Enterococcus villorum]